jgi:hypothetical protein
MKMPICAAELHFLLPSLPTGWLRGNKLRLLSTPRVEAVMHTQEKHTRRQMSLAHRQVNERKEPLFTVIQLELASETSLHPQKPPP